MMCGELDLRDDDFLMDIECPVRGEILPIIRNFVCVVAKEIGFDADEINKIEMSVDEACANVICHAYDDEYQDGDASTAPRKHTVMKMTLRASGNHIHITISDRGIGKKSGPHKGVANIEEYTQRRHGLGTYIIHKFMDKVEIKYPEGAGTTVSMIKYLSRQD